MSSHIRNLHVPLPEDLHARLRAEAERRDEPATRLVRAAIEEWLAAADRAALAKAIEEFAERYAGTRYDLDRDLEAAGLEVWRD